MSEPVSQCRRCGVRGGAGSAFKRGLCIDCQQARLRRQGTRTARYHVPILLGGIYSLINGVDGPFSFLLAAFAFFDLLAMVMTVVHETAHAVVALLFGYQVREVSLGMGPTVLRFRLGDTRVLVNLYPVGGRTVTHPRGSQIRANLFAISAAGPLSHLPLAAWLASIETGNEVLDILLDPAPELLLFYFALNVVPIIENDGRNLVRLFTMPEEMLATIENASAALAEIAPTVDDPVANPATRQQRETTLVLLHSPNLPIGDRALALNNLAAIDLLIGDPDLLDEAEGASAEAFELMPDHAAIRNTRGAALIDVGRYAEGIELMVPTMGKIPPSGLGESHLSLAYAYSALGKLYEARQHLHAARDRVGRKARYQQTLEAVGELEVPVMRRFLESAGNASAAAALFRRELGREAVTTGMALRAHITGTGRDSDLADMASLLAPE